MGTTGSGKTTLGRRLASTLGVPFVEFDAVYWGPGWAEPGREEFRSKIDAALKGDEWVADGNYSTVRDIVWSRADTLVWLDLPLPMLLGRLLVRTLRRTLGRVEIWPGCRERFLDQFASRHSLFLWALKTYGRRRRQYPVLLAESRYRHLKVIRFRSQATAERWMRSVEGS